MFKPTNDQATLDARIAGLKALPFVRDATPEERAEGRKGRIFWTAKPSGDPDADCAQGAEWARALLDHMADHPSPFLLGWIVQDMKGEPDLSGQAMGFLAVFSDLARVANMMARGKVKALMAEAQAAEGKAA